MILFFALHSLKFDIYNIKLLFSRKIHILSDYNIYLSNLFCSASLLTLFTFCFEFSNEQQQPYKCTTEVCECMKQNLVCASVKILLCRFCFCFLFFFTTNNASYDGVFFLHLQYTYVILLQVYGNPWKKNILFQLSYMHTKDTIGSEISHGLSRQACIQGVPNYCRIAVQRKLC